MTSVIPIETNGIPSLLPCPFCGGEANVIDHHNNDGSVSVGCNNDTCLGFSGLGWLYKTEAEAIAAWNTRAWTVADNDAEVLGDVTLGLFRDLMAADPETAKLWARSWPELLGEVVGE